MYVRQVDRDEGVEVARLQEQGDKRHNISHTNPILTEGGKDREGGQTAWLHSKKRKRRKGQRPF